MTGPKSTEQVTIIRSGTGHVAHIDKQGNGTIRVEQHGADHVAVSVQSGTGDRLAINQSGAGASAEVVQDGGCNATDLTQAGQGNQAVVRQSGSNNRVVVRQSGPARSGDAQ